MSDVPILSLESADVQTIKKSAFTLTYEGEYHDSLFIEHIPSIDVAPNGVVYISAERHRVRAVYQFSPKGELLDTLGRYGNQAGEFESIRNVRVNGDTLHVFDDQLRRVTRFDLEHNQTLGSTEFHSALYQVEDDSVVYFPAPIQLMQDGNYLIEYRDDRDPAIFYGRSRFYRRGNHDGEIQKLNLFSLKEDHFLIGDHAGRPSAFQLPYPERSLITETVNGVFFTARTTEFEIVERDLSGEIIRKITYPFARATLDAERLVSEQFSHNRQLQLTRESAIYPQTWPAIYTMLTDDSGNIWVAMIPENENVFEWWILNPVHETSPVEAIFNWPRESMIQTVKNGSVYAVEQDHDGFKKVVRYSTQQL
ncbi:NHL repeat-containing protein [Rhodohalobacter halophilus]|uniref:hypothetical protein n=1 Tax=Rhodohalobacter halophilus TaxID=1812810 RepID=UPI00083F561F|nr:hypothetical protein [Rhodohalobacter halophilus]